MGAWQRVAIVVTPILALATLAVGMRVGARREVHAAALYGAPRARGETAFAWQLVTFVDDVGGRETEPRQGITIHARTRPRAGSQAHEATWRGETNEDGIAEVRLDMPGVTRGEAMDVEVLVEGEPAPLARGPVAWDDEAWMGAAPGPFVRPSKRTGAIALDVAILGSKLAARTDVPLLVRATSRDDGHPIANVVVTPEPEPGLEAREATVTTCALGWARLDVSAKIYVAALGLKAKAPDGRAGEWFAGLPVATGSIHSLVPDVVTPAASGATLAVQGETGVYAEVDDDEGRAFGGWAKLPGASGNRASFEVPSLAPVLMCMVTARAPRAAATPVEATLARPFLVAGTPMPVGAPEVNDACAVGAYLALHPAGGFHRSTLLDGSVARLEGHAAERKRGLAIGLGALGIGAVLEIWLVIQSARSGRRLAADALEDVDAAANLMKRSSAGSVVIGLLLAVLGFALIAALLLLKS